MDYLFFGIQGSGKGTQTRLLEEQYGFPVFETGAELRKIAASDSELGRKVNEIISAGHLVPTEIVIEIVENFLNENKSAKTILFDGIPRSADQQELLDKLLKSHDREVTAIHIKLDEAAATNRLQLRGRNDDTPEGIKTRIQTFYDKTEPLLAIYRNANKLMEVNGDQTVEQVYSDLKSKLELE